MCEVSFHKQKTRHKDGLLLVAGVGFEPTTFGL